MSEKKKARAGEGERDGEGEKVKRRRVDERFNGVSERSSLVACVNVRKRKRDREAHTPREEGKEKRDERKKEKGDS